MKRGEGHKLLFFAAKMWVRLALGELHADNFRKLQRGTFPFFYKAFRG